MNKTDTTTLRALNDADLDTVTGGALSDVTMPQFWDPLWWEVGRTGHLPTVSILPIPR